MEAARALHANGQETAETVAAASHFGRSLGIPIALLPRWGELLLQTQAPDGHPRMSMAEVAPSGVSMNRVAATMRCIDALCANRMPLADAAAFIAAAAATPVAALPLFMLACVSGASALALIFGAIHIQAVVLIGLSAGAGAVLRRLLMAGGVGSVLQAFAAALLAGVIRAFAVRWGISSTLRLVAICPCMILVPGPHILNGALDVVALRIPLGLSRLAFASLVLGAICAGLLIGLSLGGTTLPASEPSRDVALWIDTLAAGAAAASYGVYFSMPLRMLVWPVVIGMAAHATRWWAMSALGVGVAAGAGIACLLVGAALVPVAKRLHLPFAAVGFASVVSLMPGMFVFRIASALVQQQGSPGDAALAGNALSNATTAVLVVIAMTGGLIVPKSLYDRLVALYRKVRRPQLGPNPTLVSPAAVCKMRGSVRDLSIARLGKLAVCGYPSNDH